MQEHGCHIDVADHPAPAYPRSENAVYICRNLRDTVLVQQNDVKFVCEVAAVHFFRGYRAIPGLIDSQLCMFGARDTAFKGERLRIGCPDRGNHSPDPRMN